MILDIDIRVSNDNGVQIHQFTKHFDSRFEGKRIEGGNNSVSKNFEEFLSEFLSGSGRAIRDQLITQKGAFVDTANSLSNSCNNIEYTLKLGDSQSVSGKIPLDKLYHLSEISKMTNVPGDISKSEEDAIDLSLDMSNKEAFYPEKSTFSSYDEALVMKRTPFKNPIDLAEVDKMFQQIITTAVEKYEDSFYVSDQEIPNFIESS